MSKSRPRFAIRTIRNGSVTINGVVFTPDVDANRFNGQRAVFGLYYYGGKWNNNFVSLWGGEEAYRSDNPQSALADFVEDGKYRWEWWNKVTFE